MLSLPIRRFLEAHTNTLKKMLARLGCKHLHPNTHTHTTIRCGLRILCVRRRNSAIRCVAASTFLKPKRYFAMRMPRFERGCLHTHTHIYTPQTHRHTKMVEVYLVCHSTERNQMFAGRALKRNAYNNGE